MLDSKFFDNLAKELCSYLPANLKSGLENNFKTALQTVFAKLDLVTREEFDIQVKLLEKARERITDLEEKLKLQERQESI